MPLYRYECQQCHERSEILQRVNDAPRSECPTCGGQLTKLISAPAIQFKGSGFYKTDYSNNSTSGTNNAGGKDSKSGDTEKTSSGESSTPAASTSNESSSSTAASAPAPSSAATKSE